MIRAALIVALVLGATTLASAQEIACDPVGTQSEMNKCAMDELRKADAELNSTYAQVLAELKGQANALERIKVAQRLWVQLRDADLAAQFPLPDSEYGTIHPLEVASAKTELTRQRTAYLRKQFLAPAGEGR